jgi:peptide/nickel transport system permease protein
MRDEQEDLLFVYFCLGMIFRKKRYIAGESLSRLAWIRFRKNGMGMTALGYVVLIILICTLGYLITPDNTPFANDQHLEIAARKPGFTVMVVHVKNKQPAPEQSFLHTMIWGKKKNYSSVPINEYKIEGDKIIAEGFTGNQMSEGRKYIFNTDEADVVKRTFLLGTDRFGRDLLSQIMIGARVSLSVGFISVFISLVIGISLGAVAGFFGGWVDNLIIWFINVVWSIPTLLMVIAITFALGKGFWQVFVAVGLTMWVEVARVVRGQMISIREKEFVEAGKALGFNHFRIIFRHILPNVTGPVIVISAANFAAAILIEAGLSFLGIGVQPPMPSWGTMIKENYAYIILDASHLAIFPGIAIMLLVLAFMIMGNALRDALDVKIVTRDA